VREAIYTDWGDLLREAIYTGDVRDYMHPLRYIH